MKKNTINPTIEKGVAKVPVVIQLEALECGAASLCMILSYYGKWIPLDQIRKDTGVSRDGANAKNILIAARSYGLHAEGYRFEPDALKESGAFPCIIHWNFNHYVVLCGFKKNKAIINDPAKGTYAVDMDTFDKSFTGITLLFRPEENFEPSGKQKSVIEFAKKRLKGTGSAFAFVVITTIIASLIGIIMPAFSNVFADRLLSRKNPEWFVPFMIGITLLTVVQIIVGYIQTIYSLKVNGKMAVVADSKYMWHVLRLPVEFFTQRSVGDITSRREGNATIAKQLIDTFAPLVIQAFMMIFYLFVMVRYSPVLSAIGILSVLFNTFIANFVAKKRTDIAKVASRDEAHLYSQTVSGIEMIESIKSSGSENGFFEKWAGYQAALNKSETKMLKLDAYWSILPGIIGTLTNVVVFAGSVYLCQRGEWTVGMITAFAGFLEAFLAPAAQLATVTETLQEMRTDMERIEDVFEYPVDVEYVGQEIGEDEDLRKLRGKIELKNVTFGYSRLAKPLIENFSLTIEPGQKIAFVGPSGCGKSTISNLISGLYKPWSGEILFDGKPLEEINHNVFTSSVSVVNQDIILFEDTIANNIKMWDESIEDFEMIMAARDAHIYESIMEREGGFKYKLAEGGKDLSGGQRQRLEIARTLAQDPTIIILDEATSALDAKTEFEVVRSIKDRGLTCIVVAHRLSTIRDCDEIIVMDMGEVVERGTHKELYARGGKYAELVSNE